MRNLLFLLFFFSSFLVSAQVQNILLEYSTGTNAGMSPGAEVYADSLEAANSQVIAIAVHGNDPMEVQQYFQPSNFSNFARGHFNRQIQNDEIQDWFASAQTLTGGVPIASVEIDTFVYFPATNRIEATVKARFHQAATGAFHLAMIVVEDAVVGDTNLFDQANDYGNSALGPLNGFDTLSDPVPSYQMMYNRVARGIVDDYNGNGDSIPSVVSAGDTFQHTFVYWMPFNYDPENIRVIGVLIDSASGQIINVERTSYMNRTDNATPDFLSQPIQQANVGAQYSYQIMARDPDDQNLTLAVVSAPAWLTLTQNGLGDGVISGVPPSTGIEVVNLSVTDGQHTGGQAYYLYINPGIGTEESEVTFEELKVFPNPVNDGILHLSKAYWEEPFSIIDFAGREVRKGELSGEMISIDQLPSAFYILKIGGQNVKFKVE